MPTLFAVENVTLDGVMQAPGSPDEDPRGGFQHGGWAGPYSDEVGMEIARRGMAREGGLLFGRHTYERFESVWAGRNDGNPFSPVLDARHKYVVSRTLGPPTWANTSVLSGDPVDEVRSLLAQAPEPTLALLGSGVLLRALLAADLVDELQLSICPLTLGAGTRLFDPAGPGRRFAVAESVTSTTGVLIVTYVRAT